MSGKLLVLEGIDGAGTTTQAARLEAHLARCGILSHRTREPSDGPVGAQIRRILHGEHAPFDPRALALLFAADRLDHLAREVEPQLARGAHVISDRYLLSSLVYQGRFVEPEFVRRINAAARRADLTLLLDVRSEVAAERRRLRGGPTELFDDGELQRQLVVEYRREAERLRHDQNVVIVDGAGEPDQVFAAVVSAVEICLGPSGAASLR